MRRARRFAGLVLANVVLGLLLSACASPEAASELAPTLSLKIIGGNRIAFQNGIPVPTFSYQPRRRLDLGGLWRLQSTPMNFSPMMNACASPSGDGCTTYDK